MLFHITMTHTEDNCPAYQREKLPTFVARMEKSEELARELNVKVHFLLWGSPEHIAFALIEADAVSAVSRFVFDVFSIRQEFKVTPVQHLKDVVAMSKHMMTDR